MKLEEEVKVEKKFIEEGEMPHNEHGAYCFTSDDGSTMINLQYYLYSYRFWLVENGILKEVEK